MRDSMVDVVIGKSSDGFGGKLAEALGVNHIDFRTEYYPDGEAHPRVLAGYNDLRGKHALLVYRRVQRTDRNEVARYLHNFQRLVGALTDEELFGAASVDVLMPYYVMGRQDKNPRSDSHSSVRERDVGQDVGYRHLAKAFKYSGASRILTFDPHFKREEGVEAVAWKRNGGEDSIAIHCLSAVPALAEAAREKVSQDSYIVGPDGSSSPMVEAFASRTGGEIAVFDKKRLDDTNVWHEGDVMDFKGRDVWIVDDILSTMGTVVGARKKMGNTGHVYVAATHGVLPPSGHDTAMELTRSKGPIRGIYTSDTIHNDFVRASTIPRLAEFYKGEKAGKQITEGSLT